MLKKLLFENWLAKLLCLLLAIGAWVAIHTHITNDVVPHEPEIRKSHP